MTIKLENYQFRTVNRDDLNNIRIQYTMKAATIVIEVTEKEARSLAEGITSFFELEKKRKKRK